MIAGDVNRRTYNASSFADQAITYHCLGLLFQFTLVTHIFLTSLSILDYNNDHTGDPAWGEYFISSINFTSWLTRSLHR